MFGILGIGLILVVGVLWFVIAATVALKGDTMDRSNRVAQLYGYTVCLVACHCRVVEHRFPPQCGD